MPTLLLLSLIITQLIFCFLIMNPDATDSNYIFTLWCIKNTYFFHFSCLLQQDFVHAQHLQYGLRNIIHTICTIFKYQHWKIQQHFLFTTQTIHSRSNAGVRYQSNLNKSVNITARKLQKDQIKYTAMLNVHGTRTASNH